MDSGLATPHLPAISIVENLSDDDRALLSSYGEFVSYQPGQKIFEEGESYDELIMILSGSVEMSRKHENGILTLGRAGEGCCLGEVNLFHPSPTVSTATAVEFTQAWKVSSANLEDFLTVNPVAGGNILVGIATQISSQLAQVHACLLKAQMATLEASFWA